LLHDEPLRFIELGGAFGGWGAGSGSTGSIAKRSARPWAVIPRWHTQGGVHQMMRLWTDHLDELHQGAKIIALKTAQSRTRRRAAATVSS